MSNNKVLPLSLGLVVIAGAVFWVLRTPSAPVSAASSSPLTMVAPAAPRHPAADAAAAPEPMVPTPRRNPEEIAPPAPVAAVPVAEMKPPVDEALEQAVDQLVSPQLSFPQKQAIFGQLRNSGQIGQAIAALEARQAADPASADIPTQLGMAYLINISTIQDVREQGIGGMKADLAFDTALKLDPTNWEANFMKASALSHWPDSMNMGPQVIQRFSTLIDQQEAQPSRPEFMQTYVLLGDQYQKSGRTEEARQVWNRGLTMFPGSQTLSQRLNPAP